MLICFSLHFLRGREFIALIRRGINVSHLIPSSKYCSVQSLHGPTSANANFEYFLSFLLPRGGRRIFLRSLYCDIGNKKSTFAHIWGHLLSLSYCFIYFFNRSMYACSYRLLYIHSDVGNSFSRNMKGKKMLKN